MQRRIRSPRRLSVLSVSFVLLALTCGVDLPPGPPAAHATDGEPAVPAPLRRGPAIQPRGIATRPGLTRVDRVVVKFIEGSGVRLRDGALVSTTGAADLEPLARWLRRHPGHSVARHFDRDEAALDRDRRSGLMRGAAGLADLNLYYQIGIPEAARSPEGVQDVIDQILTFPFVETAFVEPVPAPPIAPQRPGQPIAETTASAPAIAPRRGPGLPTPDYSSQQGYLGAPPAGIHATAVWGFPGGRGATVRIIDIEGAWLWTHEDLPAPFFQGGTQIDDLSWRNHGTAVIGEMAGRNNGFGVTGIATDLQVGGISIGGMSVASAINQASAAISPGDLFLIELHAPGPNSNGQGQYGYLPMEYWQDNFDAIQTAAANGRICIEAGGNGEQNLDDPVYQGRFDRTIRYSGAIMVGAGTPTGLVAEWFTNYGSRMDLNGWGSSVVTTGYGNLQGGAETEWYTSSFAGTSSASPIVSGAVASLQGMCKAEWGTTLNGPLAMQILFDSGTPWSGTKRIGRRPDLLAAREELSQGVGVVHGLVRDSETATPVAGALVRLPDDAITVLTGGNGEFELSVPTGAHPIEVTEFYHQTYAGSFSIASGETLTLELEISPRPLGAVTGTFVGPDGSPLSDGRVLFPGTPIDPPPSPGSPHYAVDGVPAGSYHVLYGLIPGFGAVARDVTVTAAQATTVNPVLAAAETFEQSDGGYAAQNPWEWGTPPGPAPEGAFSGDRVWATNLDGDYGDNQSATLTLPVVEFPGAGHLWLTMTHWYDIESGFDGGNVQILQGETWTVIEPVGGYPMTALSGLQGQSGYSGYSLGWTPAVFDLAPFLGQPLRLRFQFGSDAGVTAPGWYIDDVAFDTGEIPASVDPVSGQAGPGQVIALAPEPNPSHGATGVRFRLGSPGTVELAIFDLSGRQVRTWTMGSLAAGEHSVTWDGLDATGSRLPSGIYLGRLSIGGRTVASARIVQVR